MRRLSMAALLLLATTGPLRADDIGCISTTFNLLSPNDKVCISDFEDPDVPGVVCHVSQARKGGWGQPLGLNEDPSNFSVACRQVGPIDIDIAKLANKEEGLQPEDQHLLQGDPDLPADRQEAQHAGLSRRQLEARQRLTGEFDKHRAGHGLAGEVRKPEGARSRAPRPPGIHHSETI